MNQEELNMQVRKFLKQVGVTSQREIERAVAAALEAGKLTGNERLPLRMTLTVADLELTHTIDGELDLGA
ncbi:MAG TPA: DUF6494 family protein [Gammaproteobacteria bacterium]|jgi:hypothetical protein|nr:DUF6494 family protein [Gammaproteobacteria bacterium]